jgi:apolipoprotein N-acyltransferase
MAARAVERGSSRLARVVTPGAPSVLPGLLAGFGVSGLGGLACAALGVFWGSVRFARAPAYSCALREGLWFALGFFPVCVIGSLSWTWRVPLVLFSIGTLGWALPWALLVSWVGRRGPSWQALTVTACAWALWMLPFDALGFPLRCLTLAAVETAPFVVAGARLVGADALEGVLMAALALSAAAWARSGQGLTRRLLAASRSALLPASVVLLLALFARRTAPPSSGAIDVGVAQLNTPSAYAAERMRHPEWMESFAAHRERVLGALGRVDLVVLPESHDAALSWNVPAVRERWQRFARDHQTALVFTTFASEASGKKSNAAIVLDRAGKVAGIHRKVLLAFYGESLLEAGASFEPFEALVGVPLGVLICNESTASAPMRALVRKGAQLLAVSTNDVSFGSSVLTFGHLNNTRLRAIEAGRSVVWSSNAGPSGVIDRWGVIDAAAPFREAAAVRARALLHQDITPVVRLESQLALFLAAALLFSFWAVRSAPLLTPQGTNARAPVPPVRALFLLGTSLALAALSPAIVEHLRGDPTRAFGSLLETFVRKSSPTLDASARARFGTPRSESAAGAVHYLLSYLGEPHPKLLDDVRAARNLDELARGLERRGFSLSRIQLDPERLPRVPVLVEERTGGYGVLVQPHDERVAYFTSFRGPEVHAPHVAVERTTGVAWLVTAPR